MLEQFVNRHIGPSEKDFREMLDTIGVKSVEELISQVMPQSIRLRKPLALDEPMTEAQYAAHIRSLAERNQTLRSFIGMGYYPNSMPAAIIRNVFENPSWYTSYTPLTFGSLQALMCFSDVSFPLEDFSLLFSLAFYMEKCLCHLCLSPLET